MRSIKRYRLSLVDGEVGKDFKLETWVGDVVGGPSKSLRDCLEEARVHLGLPKDTDWTEKLEERVGE